MSLHTLRPVTNSACLPIAITSNRRNRATQNCMRHLIGRAPDNYNGEDLSSFIPVISCRKWVKAISYASLRMTHAAFDLSKRRLQMKLTSELSISTHPVTSRSDWPDVDIYRIRKWVMQHEVQVSCTIIIQPRPEASKTAFLGKWITFIGIRGAHWLQESYIKSQ